VEEGKGVAESSMRLISGDDTWRFGNGTFKKRVNEGNSLREIRVNNVAHWQSDRDRQTRHAASFLGDVAIRGEGKGLRKATGSNQNRRCVGVGVSGR